MKPNLHIFAILIVVLTACISEKKIERRYYTIEIPVDQTINVCDSISRLQGTCELEQVVVNNVYAKNQIVNRAGSNEISYYIYNQWAVNPSDAITQLIREYFEIAGIFQNLSDSYSRTIPDFRFQTYINSLELIENKRSLSAHLALEFRLIDNSTNKVILTHKASRTTPLKQNDLNIFAQEVSKIILQELNIFAGTIIDKRDLFSGDTEQNKN